VTDQSSRAALLVPPRRLGELLTGRRAVMGMSLADVERIAVGRFSAGDLHLFETGQAAATDDQLRHLAGIYGVDLGSITPQRATLSLDIGEGLVAIGGESERFAPDHDDREILLRYLAIVYRMRAINPGVSIPARNDDLDTLAQVFSTTPAEIRSTLESLMTVERIELRSRHAELKRRIIVPGLGVLVALTTIGGLLLVRSNNGGVTMASAPTPSAATSVDIGTALVIERSNQMMASKATIGDALIIER
jgi:transcriptional regulator with XRE-family HTH domain